MEDAGHHTSFILHRSVKLDMRTKSTISLLLFLVLSRQPARAQGTVPTFVYSAGQSSYTLAGRDPVQGGTTIIPAVLVPIALSFETRNAIGKPFLMDAGVDVSQVLRSPIFSTFTFASGNSTQYADAMLRSTFPSASGWHTLLAKPEIKPIRITVPAGYGYILTSKKNGSAFAVVDVEYLQQELFKQLPKQDGKLVIAVTHNTTFYTEGDATLCCSWGTHGIDSATGNSFVLGSYLSNAPAVVEDSDVQPLTQQLAEFINDPLHDPLLHGRNVPVPGNTFHDWRRPPSRSGKVVAAARTLPPPTSSSNPQIQTRRTIFPRQSPMSLMQAKPPTTCRTWRCFPGTSAPRRVLATRTAFPTRRHSLAPAKPCAPVTPVSTSPNPTVTAVSPQRITQRTSAYRLLDRHVPAP